MMDISKKNDVKMYVCRAFGALEAPHETLKVEVCASAALIIYYCLTTIILLEAIVVCAIAGYTSANSYSSSRFTYFHTEWRYIQLNIPSYLPSNAKGHLTYDNFLSY
jgi:hypothetical protein